MAAGDTPLASTHFTVGSSGKVGSSGAFFTKLKGRAKRIANDQSWAMVESMKYILTHRQSLKGGNGSFPMWDGSNNTKSKRSYSKWTVKKHGVGFALENKSKDEGFTYVSFLTHGASMARAPSGWFESALRGETLRGKKTKLKINKGRVFSSQMEFGLNPWLVIKREELKDNIRKEFKRLGVKK